MVGLAFSVMPHVVETVFVHQLIRHVPFVTICFVQHATILSQGIVQGAKHVLPMRKQLHRIAVLLPPVSPARPHHMIQLVHALILCRQQVDPLSVPALQSALNVQA